MKFCFWGNISGALQGRNPGGGELQIAYLAKALALKGHEVVIVDPYSKNSFITEEGVKLINVPGWNKGIKGLRLFFNRIPSLWRTLVAQKADYYYVRMRSYLHILPFLAAKKNKGKFITGIASDIDVMSFKKKYKYSYKGNFSFLRVIFINIPNDFVFRSLLRKSDKVILQHSGQQFGSLKLQKRQSVFPNIIKFNDSSAINKRCSGGYYLYVGSITVLKGADNLLNLVNLVNDSIPFRIVGLPLGNKPVKIYQKLRDRRNVELLGRKDHKETLELISGAKALINTSYYEGFSNVFLEAWSLGVPVISLSVDPGNILEEFGLGVNCRGNLSRMKEAIESDETAKLNTNNLFSYLSRFHNFNSSADRFIKILNSSS
ncbi:MAG: glycosyltransferase family 4 protein [Bacteroidetes bacterium]|nr:glycosyltransferase family 4 protein [Bacteroidota bacterium]